MSKSLGQQIRKDVEDSWEDIAAALRGAADKLTNDAERGVSEAAATVKSAAERLAAKTPEGARDLARRTAGEIKEHPIASAAAALTAAAALISILATLRKKAD